MPIERVMTFIGDIKEPPMVQTDCWPVKCDVSLNFVTPQLEHALKIWRAKRGARTMPARADMTFRDLRPVLANLAFLAIVDESGRQRFKVRLMGGALDDYLTPMTGRFVDEVVPTHFADKWTALWRPAIDGRRPVRSVNHVEYGKRRWYVAEAFYAPLADDGEKPDVLMIAACYHVCNAQDAPPSAIAMRLTSELADCTRIAMA